MAWALVKDSDDVRTLEVFRRQYGVVNPFYDRLAEARIERLKENAAAKDRERVALLQKQEEERQRVEKEAQCDAELGRYAVSNAGGSIGRDLDARDRELARQAEYDAWERGAQCRAVRWRNPDSGRYGEIIPGPYHDRFGSRCRNFVHYVWIEGRKRGMRGTACRNPDGTWTQIS